MLELWWTSWHSIAPTLVHPEPREAWKDRWQSEICPSHEVVIALDDELNIVGFAAANLARSELAQLFVSPRSKRQGIGGELLSWGKQVMPAGFTLHTLTQNLASRAFYRNHGLREGSRRINSFNGLETVEYRWTR